MPTEVLTAFIALIGVVISVVVSNITAVWQSRSETNKILKEMQRNLSEKLFEKRIESYTTFFIPISRTIQSMNFGEFKANELRELLVLVRDMEARTAILMSATTQQASYRLIRHLYEWSKKRDEEIEEIFNDYQAAKPYKTILQEMELALKNDLGIYSFDSPLLITKQLPIDSYVTVNTKASSVGNK